MYFGANYANIIALSAVKAKLYTKRTYHAVLCLCAGRTFLKFDGYLFAFAIRILFSTYKVFVIRFNKTQIFASKILFKFPNEPYLN